MVKIKKRSGAMQPFDEAKLRASLKKAGAREENAAKVAESVAGKVKEGATTAEIKRMAATELRGINQQAAQSYQVFQKTTK